MSEIDNLEKRLEDMKAKFIPTIKKEHSVKRISAFHVIADLIAGMAVGGGIGYGMDSYFQTIPLFLFICIILGIAAGIYNAYNAL